MEKNLSTRTEISYTVFGKDDRKVSKTKICSTSNVSKVWENLEDNGAMDFKFRVCD